MAELVLLARVLTRVPARRRKAEALRLLRETEFAAAHLWQTGQAHPQFGDGSLLARCHLADPPPEPLASDRDFLRALCTAAGALRHHHGA